MVFERAKFMVQFAGAYRRSRKAGAQHGAALQAATGDMLGESDSLDISETVVELWCTPDEFCGLDDGDWFGDGSFDITAAHLSLLQQMRLSWDGAERGAPMLDPQRPYGRTDLLTQLGEVFGSDDPDALARRHVEMLFTLARALKHGALAPGRYAPGNITAAEVREVMRGYDVGDADLGLDADGPVTVTDEHLRLLRAIEIRWPSESECEDRLAAGEYPCAAADAKRPYGDFTFIEVDMAAILGELPPVPDGNGPATFEPSPELAERLQRLHWQMLVSMQVFVERAVLAPGRYPLYPAD